MTNDKLTIIDHNNTISMLILFIIFQYLEQMIIWINNISRSVYRYLSTKSMINANVSPQRLPDPTPQVFVKSNWIPASKTRNYALQDTLIDWLDYYGTSVNNSTTGHSEYSFTKLIMNKGIVFETYVINLIKSKFNASDFVMICTNIKHCLDNAFEYEERTKTEILKGTPIIYQPMLMNKSGPLSYSYGMPDLLVRSDYLKLIVPTASISETYKAPNLNGQYHYVVVDIKFTTLELCADGVKLRNSGSIPAYKCQLYIYNHALELIQGYEPSCAYILGRKYKYETSVGKHQGNDCFDKLGSIVYQGWDKKYVDETIAAINWIKKCREDGSKWSVLPVPSVVELYPNMSSTNESRWSHIKLDYAIKLGEITMLWNCGIKNRQIAHSNNIYSIWDPDCCAEKIGLKKSATSQLIDEIIKINQQTTFNSPLDRIKLIKNSNVDNSWIKPTQLRIMVDFEIINNIFDDFTALPKSNGGSYLFMIGVAHKAKDMPIAYRAFVLPELTKGAEYEMICQFYDHLRQITDCYVDTNAAIPPLYHWGHIEKSYFTKLLTILSGTISIENKQRLTDINSGLKWHDMLSSFKLNPIVINGCFGFGLKEISNRLFDLDLISSNWKQTGSNCIDGNTAMTMAFKEYQHIKNTTSDICSSSVMKEIIAYNRIDCMVLNEITDVLQRVDF